MNITESLPAFEKMQHTFSNKGHETLEIKHRDLKEDIKTQANELKDNLPLTDKDIDKIASATNSIKEYMNSMQVKLEFQIHKESNQVQVSVVNPENEKVIRKIPADEILELAASIEEMVGLFLNKNL
ncbi:MAG: flagellar protein FlaG [Desulfonatronovibrio sp.]